MVELKSGETYNGTLKGVDKFMNIQMENCIRTDNVFLTIMIERRNLS
jgi:small nuclear ribonucleoprotein (snRNP)-like protein